MKTLEESVAVSKLEVYSSLHGQSLWSILTRVKDKLPSSMHSCIVCHIPYSCDKVYIGETVRKLEMRIKEHKVPCKKDVTEKYAVAEHAWTNQHPIL